MKKEHTRGPWQVTGPSKHGAFVRVKATIPGSKFHVANVPFGVDTRNDQNTFFDLDQATADANLIACAPEMLEALKDLRKCVDGAVFDALVELIHRAEGK